MQPLQAALSMWTRFQHFSISQNRFSKVFSLPLEENFGEKIDLKGNIVLSNLSFAYKDGALLFDNVNLSINQGEFVSIIGSNGAGKTTLSHLMIGDLTPKEGSITIDGFAFADINVPHFRKQVVYLEPNGTIFKGTIMENLTFFGSFGTLDDVMHLSQKIGLDKWINKQPLGYNTVIGHHLDGDLSLGILQRICFVRGILMKPKVLIIDEANTSFDIQGDQKLADLLQEFKGKITVIFITHRPSLSRLADRTYKISNNTLEVYHESPRL
jgi:ATP-binding cassette subfamily C protein LapB